MDGTNAANGDKDGLGRSSVGKDEVLEESEVWESCRCKREGVSSPRGVALLLRPGRCLGECLMFVNARHKCKRLLHATLVFLFHVFPPFPHSSLCYP